MTSLFLKIIIFILLSVCFVSAVQLLLIRYESRQAFIQLQQLQQQRDQLNIEWGQLQLEQSTYAQPNRIETIARQQLHMVLPQPNTIIPIKP